MRIFLIIFLCSAVLNNFAANLASGASYRVFPGEWNRRCLKDKNLSKLIKTGLDEKSGKYDGKLTDGDIRKSAVNYNYHGIPQKQRVLTVEFDLGKVCDITGLKLNASYNNSLYKVEKVIFSGSSDGLTWKKLGECQNDELKLKNYLYTIDLQGKWQNIRYLRFSVTSGNSWINLTEITIEGTPSNNSAVQKKTITRTLNVPKPEPGMIPVVFIKSRLTLPTGEELGKHCLKIDFNGSKKLTLLNRPQIFTDSQTGLTMPVVDAHGYYLVKADADYQPFNAAAGEPYSDTYCLNRAFSAESANRMYCYTFRADAPGIVKITAEIPEGTEFDIREFSCRKVAERFFFARNWMQGVLPDTFPQAEEKDCIPTFKVAKNEIGVTACSLFSFLPGEGRFELIMPDGKGELFEIRNTPVEFSRNFAKENEIANLGEMILPEWWVPDSGNIRQVPVGSMTLGIRFTPDKGAKPGIKKGSLQWKDKSGKIVAYTGINYEILPFELPEYDDVPAAFGLYIMGNGTSRMGADFWQDMRDHGITLTFMTPWGTPLKMGVDQNKNLTVDFSKFNARLKEFQKFGINRKMVLFGTAEPLISQLKKISGQNPGEPEFDRRFKEFIGKFTENSAKLGVPVNLSLYDEANFKPEEWKKTVILTKLAKMVPGSRLWCTSTSNGAAYLMYRDLGYQKDHDIVLTHPAKLLEQEDSVALNAAGIKNYTTVGEVKKFHLRGEYNDVFAYPGEGARYDFGLRAYRGDLKTFFAFAYWWGSFQKDNFQPRKRYYINIPFPEMPGGKSGSTSGWEAVRCGIDDYRYLVAAEKVLAEKVGVAAARKELYDLIKSDSPRPELFDPDHYEEIRKKLTDVIRSGK